MNIEEAIEKSKNLTDEEQRKKCEERLTYSDDYYMILDGYKSFEDELDDFDWVLGEDDE